MAKSGNKWLGVAICGFMWLKVVLCRPFWMSEIHFQSQFWPFQIDTEFNCFFSAAILDVRKSLSMAFLAISYRSAILDVQNSLSMAFLAISDPYGS